MEKFEQTSQDIKEFEWVKQQVKAELQSLQQNVQQELFYQKEGDKVTYNLDLVKTYLEHIKDRSWSQLTEKNSSAWIMAVQIALEHQGYDVEKVDGLWWEATKAAIERFQGANELVKDGKPWTFTIQKLLEGMWSSASQAETSETPTETAGTPTETSETPTETAGTPTETSGTPTETTGTPTETTETPTKTSGTPTKTSGTPTKTSGTPTKTSGTPTKTSGTPTETAKTPTEKPQTQTEKAGEVKEIDLNTLGAWDENGNFVFKDGVEKTDQKGKYIEIQGKKYYKYKKGMTWLGYNAFIEDDGTGKLWYWKVLNGKFYKQVFQYYSDGEIKETHWNKMGNQIKQISKKADGTINWEYNYEYDEKGNQIKQIKKNADGTVAYEYNYEYDEKGNQIKQIKKNADGTVAYEYNYEYDEKGNQIKQISKNTDGTIDSEYNYEYDEKGNQIKQIKKNADGTINWEENYEYDEKGNKIKEIRKNTDGTITNEFNYEYDEKGNKIKRISKNADGTIKSEENYEYDEKGNKIKEIIKNADGTIKSEENYEYDEKGNKIKQIKKKADGTIDYEYNYEYDEKGNKIKRIRKKADGTIESEENYDQNGKVTKKIKPYGEGIEEYNYEYDEGGNMINLKREGADNNNYNVAYTYDENGNKKAEKTDHIIGITTERDYNENEEIIKEKKTYHDDKPVIEWKFDNEWELIKEEVENQEDEAKESSYTGQVNAYNKQKHGSGTTIFKDKQTEGGYYENGELLFWGEKNEDNYAQQRGTVKLKEVYKVDKEKKRYQERTVESWGNTITLIDTASGYTFSTRSGAKLILPKDLWRKKALNAANLINAAVGIVKQSGNELDYFEADGNRLEADYKVSASNLRYGLQDATLIENVNEKFWVSAKELAAWLNEYRKELGI